ncbi:MAG: PIN domain-containing protein, partial [Acidimicrobiia bacterium]
LAVAGLQPRNPITARRLDAAERSYLLDSSAAVDGRLLHLARAGLIEGRVWVPSFVVDELQSLADASDRERRRRGRRGLEVVEALQSALGVEVSVLDDSVPEHEDVDAKLAALAVRASATLVTTDHNLAKAAGLRGVLILNPQALSESLKPAVASGDRLHLAIAKAGSEPGQGVGYLDDGTMVVVEGAGSLVGEELTVEVTGVTRTAIGRMLFARPVG